MALIAEELDDLNAVYIRGDVPTADGQDNPYATYSDVSDSEEETREERIKKFKTDDSWSWWQILLLQEKVSNCTTSVTMQYISTEHSMPHNSCNLLTEYTDMEYGLDDEGDIICAKHDTNIEILTCNNSIDQMIHKNLKRKMEAMYTWLNDQTLTHNWEFWNLPFQMKKSNNGDSGGE